MYTENSNKPHGSGIIDPNNFSPYPKNPVIARFFKEIGGVEELGSGVRNIYKYSKQYSGKEPQFIEGDVFKTVIPITQHATQHATQQVTQHATPQVGDKIRELLEFCKTQRSRSEMQQFMGIRDREYFRTTILNPLIDEGSLKLAIPDKPKSPKQKYYSE